MNNRFFLLMQIGQSLTDFFHDIHTSQIGGGTFSINTFLEGFSTDKIDNIINITSKDLEKKDDGEEEKKDDKIDENSENSEERRERLEKIRRFKFMR